MNLIDIESSIGFRFWCVWTTRWSQSHISTCSSVVHLESQSHIIHDISHIHSYLTNTHSGSYPYVYIYISEGSLEVKLPTIWIDEKQRWKGSERRGVEERRSEKRKSQKKEDADVRKGRKVAKHCVFPMICGSGGSKSRLAKAAGAEPSGQMRDEKLHAVVARSTFRSQNVQNTPCSDHFWKLRC